MHANMKKQSGVAPPSVRAKRFTAVGLLPEVPVSIYLLYLLAGGSFLLCSILYYRGILSYSVLHFLYVLPSTLYYQGPPMLLCSMLSGVLPLLSMPCYLLHATTSWHIPQAVILHPCLVGVGHPNVAPSAQAAAPAGSGGPTPGSPSTAM